MNNNKFYVVLLTGILLAIAGFSSDGLWPWQLPACMVGGFLISFSFRFYEKRN